MHYGTGAAVVLTLMCGACDTAGVQVDPETPTRTEAPADSAAGETAFELVGAGGAALVVPVHVNGEGPFNFVLDTGATLTCVEDDVAEQLGLQEASGVSGIGAGVAGTGRMRLVEIDSLRVGDARATGLNACALDLQHTSVIGIEIDGLLGLNFLRAFRMTLDFQREILLLTARE